MSTNCVWIFQRKNAPSNMKMFVYEKNQILTILTINFAHIDFYICIFCDVNKQLFILANVINPRLVSPKTVIYIHKKSEDYFLHQALQGPKVEFLQCFEYCHKWFEPTKFYESQLIEAKKRIRIGWTSHKSTGRPISIGQIGPRSSIRKCHLPMLRNWQEFPKTYQRTSQCLLRIHKRVVIILQR